MNAGLRHQVPDAWVSILELLANKLHQQEQELPTQHLVAMDSCCIAEFWFSQFMLPWIIRYLHSIDLKSSKALANIVDAGDGWTFFIHHLHKLSHVLVVVMAKVQVVH